MKTTRERVLNVLMVTVMAVVCLTVANFAHDSFVKRTTHSALQVQTVCQPVGRSRVTML